MTSLAHAALDQLSALLGKRCLTDPDSAHSVPLITPEA